ncbi:LolA family protein [Arenimonas sp.]|uniref:LolA family protein n=1 Tax=Arenimonas sp. TaxID=1872635 RepID=UPI0039E5DA0C
MKRLFWAFAVLLGCLLGQGASWAADVAPGVRARLVQAPVLRGAFEQEKRLQGFRNPLRSQGDFILSRERGIVWNTRKPFASTLVLGKDRLQAKQADGRKQDLIAAGNSQALSVANGLMLALVGGNIDGLATSFDVREFLSADGSWALVLVPKRGPLQKAFQRIELQGDRYVRRVVLSESRGDRTEIKFSGIADLPASLSADEARQFD